ncbi:hypothetical protein [Agitococcus lubricus]|uniref:START domain-containing protein n=1 Tax=Agitococcus lubricus TaxID=1077255 RepID=A0A2T5ISD2_9GAMM|nr:hypothetical protein [Agitococcus lubricus]PTQ86739.1 hypothetical protein C8N29_1326 [Agitococcus lubricus]
MSRLPHILFASMMALAVTPSISFAVDNDLKDIRPDINKNEWQLVKNDTTRNIKTYIREVDGKRINFKVDAMIDGDLATVARVHFDVDNIKHWFWETLDSRLLKKVSSTEYYYYMQYNAPVTMPDRDAILHAVVEPYTAKKGYMQLTINAVPDYLPVQANLVRVQAQDMTVKFTPMGKDKVHIAAEGFVDPGGIAPTWAMNFVQRNAPYSTMLGLQRRVNMAAHMPLNEPLPFAYME